MCDKYNEAGFILFRVCLKICIFNYLQTVIDSQIQFKYLEINIKYYLKAWLNTIKGLPKDI